MKYSNFCLFVLFCLCFIFFILCHIHIHNSRAVVAAAEPISDVCLGCIFSALTDLRCEDPTCGLFKITQTYWTDAGRHTLKQESPDSPYAFKNCTKDLNCAAATVSSYMAKFAQGFADHFECFQGPPVVRGPPVKNHCSTEWARDCNDDGTINCNDYMALHVLGSQCAAAWLLPRQYVAEFNHCTDEIGS